MNWSEDEDLQVNYVQQCMEKKCYLDIIRNLHFNDNSLLHTQDNPKRSYKTTPLLQKLNKKYLLFGIFCNELSIDEQIVR